MLCDDGGGAFDYERGRCACIELTSSRGRKLEENLASLTVEVTEDDRKAVDALIRPGTNTEDYYLADFGPHPHRV